MRTQKQRREIVIFEKKYGNIIHKSAWIVTEGTVLNEHEKAFLDQIEKDLGQE